MIYLLFSGESYYAEGGWGDFVGGYINLPDAEKMVAELPKSNWWHIIQVTEHDYLPIKAKTGKYCGKFPEGFTPDSYKESRS